MGMSTGGSGDTSAKPNINITPLIDVLLVMIIIFMVIKHNNPHRFESKVPEKPPDVQPNPPPPPDPFTLVLSVGFDGKIKLNSTELTAEQLKIELKKTLDTRATDKRTIFLKAPRAIHYAKVAELIDIAKGAGAQPIGLQIDFLDEK